MISQPEMYFRRLVPDRQELFIRLEAEAAAEEIPIVGPVVGELLFILSRCLRAERIVELGTATGYSAMYMAAALEHHGRLTTFESDAALADRARENVRAAGLEEQVEVICGNALDMLGNIPAGVDLVFIDIEKEDYARVLPQCRRMLRAGGLLVADNVAFADADPFNRDMAADDSWRSVSLYSFLPGHSPQHDGLCMALRM
jgi:predicted O-methyltransferase YrrM